jgi:hypothetical protein
LPMPAGVSNLAVASAPAVEMQEEDASFGAGGLGLRGIGSGGRSRSMSMPAPAAPPRLMKAEAKRASSGGDVTREERNGACDKKGVVARAVVVKSVPADLAADAALVAVVNTLLAAIDWTSTGAPTTRGQVVLRLHVYASGKVVVLDVVSGDAKLAAFLAAKLRAGLLGATPAARGDGAADGGALFVTIRVSAL